jgi:hypothetical protein
MFLKMPSPAPAAGANVRHFAAAGNDHHWRGGAVPTRALAVAWVEEACGSAAGVWSPESLTRSGRLLGGGHEASPRMHHQNKNWARLFSAPTRQSKKLHCRSSSMCIARNRMIELPESSTRTHLGWFLWAPMAWKVETHRGAASHGSWAVTARDSGAAVRG